MKTALKVTKRRKRAIIKSKWKIPRPQFMRVRVPCSLTEYLVVVKLKNFNFDLKALSSSLFAISGGGRGGGGGGGRSTPQHRKKRTPHHHKKSQRNTVTASSQHVFLTPRFDHLHLK